LKPEIREQLMALYAEVDAAVANAGPKCDASGRCCRFVEWDHVLYISSPEAEFLLDGAPPFQQPVGIETCPFQKERLCTAREHRPLGCRVYFCDPAYQTTGNDIMEAAVQKLKQFCDCANIPWRYAPLHVFLNESPHRNVDEHGIAPVSRIALPLTAAHE
jgi:Fe-S-cluster containining protein